MRANIKPEFTVVYSQGQVYVWWFSSRWPGSSYFWKVPYQEWLEGNYEFERRKND